MKSLIASRTTRLVKSSHPYPGCKSVTGQMPHTPWEISDLSLGVMSYGKIRQERIVAGPMAALKEGKENSTECSLRQAADN